MHAVMDAGCHTVGGSLGLLMGLRGGPDAQGEGLTELAVFIKSHLAHLCTLLCADRTRVP